MGAYYNKKEDILRKSKRLKVSLIKALKNRDRPEKKRGVYHGKK